MAFLDLLPVGRVIDRIVNVPPEVEDGLRVRGFAVSLSIKMTIQCLGSRGDFGTEGSVRAIHSGNIRSHGQRAVNYRVF
jgi:hypothetical protein